MSHAANDDDLGARLGAGLVLGQASMPPWIITSIKLR